MRDYIKGTDIDNGLCTKTKIYGLESSLEKSGFPMRTEEAIEYWSEKIKRGEKLGRTEIGGGHDNYLLGIVVQFDLEFTNKAWVEAERYHFFDIVSSMSTMHRITKFDLDKAYNEYVDPRVIDIMKEKVSAYNRIDFSLKNDMWETEQRKEEVKRQQRRYLEILYTNPAGFKLKAGMTTNYRQLKTIWVQRHNHRLPEWREFCDWCLKLPYFQELTGCGL